MNLSVWHLLTLCCTLITILSVAPQSSWASEPMPEDSMKMLPLASEPSVSTFLPSSAALGHGIALNIIYPEKSRYKDGAPIAIVIPGGDTPNGLNFCMHTAQIGVIEIRFAFPGGGIGDFKSEGYNDYRGVLSQRALRDVLLFAAGKSQDFHNKTIADLVPIKISTNNIGIVGWSNGGNIALITMSKYARQLGFINWLALYECPLGSLFFPPSLGSTHDFLLNTHYRQGSAATGHCLLDYRKLAWQGNVSQNPGIHKKLGEPELLGVLYFDDNKNNKWDESTEFAFNYSLDRGLNKKIYPPDVTAAMERLRIFDQIKALVSDDTNKIDSPKEENNVLKASPSQAKPVAAPNKLMQSKLMQKIKKTKPVVVDTSKNKTDSTTETKADIHFWPRSVAKLEEAESYFKERDGSLAIPSVCRQYPGLLITIFASQVDHLQTQTDHPHIVLQYNTFLENNAHWIRLNPESIYLGDMSNMNKRNFVQNEPNTPIEAVSISDYLEPECVLKDYAFMNATVAELADRVHTKNLKSPLTMPLYVYSNGISPALSNKDSIEQNK